MLISRVNWGGDALIICDTNCEKAWGVNHRPRIYLDDPDQLVYPNRLFHTPEQNPTADYNEWDMDNTVFLSDAETGKAPDNPGTYEGGDAKPLGVPKKHNKWCLRECERSECVMLSQLSMGKAQGFKDFRERLYNKEQKGG
jgi:hypothetical protein